MSEFMNDHLCETHSKCKYLYPEKLKAKAALINILKQHWLNGITIPDICDELLEYDVFSRINSTYQNALRLKKELLRNFKVDLRTAKINKETLWFFPKELCDVSTDFLIMACRLEDVSILDAMKFDGCKDSYNEVSTFEMRTSSVLNIINGIREFSNKHTYFSKNVLIHKIVDKHSTAINTVVKLFDRLNELPFLYREFGTTSVCLFHPQMYSLDEDFLIECITKGLAPARFIAAPYVVKKDVIEERNLSIKEIMDAYPVHALDKVSGNNRLTIYF